MTYSEQYIGYKTTINRYY